MNPLTELEKFGRIEGAWRDGSHKPWQIMIVRHRFQSHPEIVASSQWCRTKAEAVGQCAYQLGIH